MLESSCHTLHSRRRLSWGTCRKTFQKLTSWQKYSDRCERWSGLLHDKVSLMDIAVYKVHVRERFFWPASLMIRCSLQPSRHTCVQSVCSPVYMAGASPSGVFLSFSPAVLSTNREKQRNHTGLHMPHRLSRQFAQPQMMPAIFHQPVFVHKVNIISSNSFWLVLDMSTYVFDRWSANWLSQKENWLTRSRRWLNADATVLEL